MVFLQEVHEFVAEEVLQAMERPFCQFKIDRDTFVPRVTGAPPRLHFSDLPVADFYLNDSLPLVDESRQEMLQFRAVPRIHNFSLALRLLRVWIERSMERSRSSTRADLWFP